MARKGEGKSEMGASSSSSDNDQEEYTGPMTRSRTAAAAAAAAERNRNQRDMDEIPRNEDRGQKRDLPEDGDASSPPKRVKVNSNPRETLSQTRVIVKQQNQAFQESLKADQEKERIKEEEAKAKLAEKEKLQLLMDLKRESRENLPPEADSNDNEAFTLQFRFPSGTSIRRAFRRSDPVACLQQFVFAHEEAPYAFNVIAYPNRLIPLTGADAGYLATTLEDVGLVRKELLHVRAADDEDKNTRKEL